MKTTSKRQAQLSKALNVSTRHVRRLIDTRTIDPSLSIPQIRQQMEKNVRKQVGGVKKGYKRPGNGSKKPRKRDAGPIKGSLPWITLQREKVKLQKEELDLRQRNGELLDADKVRTEAFNMGRSLRDAVLNVPDRLSMILSAENSPEKIHRALTEEFRRIFEAFVSENRSTGTVTI